jgi:hypothetical protein
MKQLYLLLFGMMLFPLAHAKIVRVNNNGGMAADYDNLAPAAAGATAGDTIHIEGSVTPYTGNVNVSKKLTIIGPGYFLGSTAETQYNKETAKLNLNITFGAGSEGSVLAGVVHYAGETTAGQINPAATTLNKVVVQAGNISIINCKLYYVQIDNTQPLSNIFIQRCFFNPGVIMASGAGVVSNLTIINNFFRNGFTNYPVIVGAAGKQSQWRISQNTFYLQFNVTAENTTFTHNAFYGTSATVGTISTHTTNAYTDNVMRYAVGGMINGTDRNVVPPTTVTEDKWFSRTGNNANIDIYFTAASSNTDCPLRDGSAPGDDTRQKGMYGGGAPYVPSGMFTIPSVYDIQMDAEVGDNFNMVIKARTH